jgi:hypothetical protein
MRDAVSRSCVASSARRAPSSRIDPENRGQTARTRPLEMIVGSIKGRGNPSPDPTPPKRACYRRA